MCLLRDLMLFALELKLCRTLWSVDKVHMGVCAGLHGKDAFATLVRKYTCPENQHLQSTG